MEPTIYQKKILKNLKDFLSLLEDSTPGTAYRKLWQQRDVRISVIPGEGMPPYRNTITDIPHVCFKVPTGGGKTFLAACAVRLLRDSIVQCGECCVVWLVPSDTILEQTLANLRNTDHPYRHQLQKDFPVGVEVYSKEQLLSGQNFQNILSVQEHLSVFVLSFDSFRTSKKDGRRAYRENERLMDFPVCDNLPDDVDESSLVNAIRALNPIVIVDESHHTTSKLSVDMLKNFNPRFILDLTATPKENSNIIAFAEASDLKKENMVKLPLIVYNRADKKDVMYDAIQLRNQIEQQALEEEKINRSYIRPIVLFQAQPRGKEDASTFQKLKEELTSGGIPTEQIAIKTADVNELKNINLFSRDCKIRYIITVNALKEGWDCSFAYILATLANKTSKVDVEQIVGRILRQPYAKLHEQKLLNNSFVLTCSNDFASTLSGIVTALNKAGYSKKDVRIADERQQPLYEPQADPGIAVGESETAYSEDFLGDYSNTISMALEQKPSDAVEDMLTQAISQTQDYEREADESNRLGYLGGQEGAMKDQYKINEQFREETEAILLPQFCFETEPNLFHSEKHIKLSKEKLSAGFSLQNADSNVSFTLSSGELYAVDVSESGKTEYRKMTKNESEYIRKKMERLPDEGKRRFCVELLASQLERRPIGDIILRNDINKYVERIVSNLSNDDFFALQTGYQFYANRIYQKIELLLDDYRESKFINLLESSEIKCNPMFELPGIITPTETLSNLAKSLYESEAAVNTVERKVIEEIAALKNIKWWHRIAERKPYSFCINAFINHYPDFLVMTEKGRIIVVEVKGDDRDNSDSERKLRLGRKWAEKAGEDYRYYMVFDNLNWSKEGAYDLSEFVGLIERL